MTTQTLIKVGKAVGVFATTFVLSEIVRRAVDQAVDATVEESKELYDTVCPVEEHRYGFLNLKKKLVRRNRITGKTTEI